MKIFRDALILIVIFIAVWLIASRFFNSVSPPNTFLSESQRDKLSEWINKQIEAEYKVIDKHVWSESLEEILNRIQSELGDSINRYEIVVLDKTTVNAFASIGNRVYVFKGLLQLAESPGEAASVIAHEIAHIHLNHVEKKLISEFGLSVLMTVFSGGDVLVAGEIMRTLSLGAFSRKQEGEADDFALKIMHDSGIDPAYLGIMFRRIKDAHPAGIDIPLEMFQSHPDIKKRIKKSLEYSKDAFSEVPFAIEWPTGPTEEG